MVSLLQTLAVDYDYSSYYDTQTTDAATGAVFGGMLFLMLYLVIGIVLLVSMWKLFVKAGKPGWAAIVPIYNTVVLLEIVGRPLWWIVLFFIPFVNIVVAFIVINDLSKSFGKDVGYTLGLIFLSFIFYPMLAFGNAKYLGPKAGVAAPAAPKAPSA